uniref:F-box domain-containing protein n=1 Tax=Globodera pallida TaxID=36090 RepID=A0A183BMS2_GLOPA
MELNSTLEALHEEETSFKGDLDSSFGSDLHSVSFQEISSVLRAKPDINVFYRTPCSGANRFSRRSSSAHALTDHFSHALPDSLLLRIFFYLNKHDIVNVMLVCRRFGQIAKDKTLWEFMNLAGRLIDEESIHSLFNRQLKVLRLASAEVKTPSLFPWFDVQHTASAQLTHLDLSQAKFDTSDTLVRLLSRCKSLQALSLESCDLLDDECCRVIANNSALKYLDLVYAKRFSVAGIGTILCACQKLVELNLSWAEVDDEAMLTICQRMPSGIRKLNLSGFRQLPSLNDENIGRLCAVCPQLEELDLSDNALLTEHCLESICDGLKRLRRLTLSRCYGIEPMAFLQLGTLDELNIFGCITNDGVCLLRNRLAPTQVNASPYSTVAKPTVGDSITSIWRHRTRDLY